MLARIAQELFWLGRDLTRAEHTARMLDGVFHADVAGATGDHGVALSWEGVLAIIGAKPPAPGEEVVPTSLAVSGGLALEANPTGPTSSARRTLRGEVARLLTLDTASPASIVSCVARARDRGRTLRDVISTEMWEALNSFYLALGRYDLQAALRTGPYSVYQEVKERCACSGDWSTARCCATRADRSLRPAAASSKRTWSCGCCGWPCHPNLTANRGARADTRAKRLPSCTRWEDSRRIAARYGRRRRSGSWHASCSTTAPIPAPSPRRLKLSAMP